MKSWEQRNNAHTIYKRTKRRAESKKKRFIYNCIKINGIYIDETKNKATIRAPRNLCIYTETATKKSINFICKIRSESKKRKRRIHLDFSELTYISAAAMLLLLATVDHIKRTKPDNKITTRYPKSEKSESIFNQTGFTNVLGRKLRETASFDDVSYWSATSGSDTRPENSVTLFEEIEKSIPDHNQKLLYKGFLEAMANCVEHAYAHLHSSMLSRHSRWWAFGGVYEDRVILLIIDLGLGIPKTLPKVIESSWLDRTLVKIGVSTHNDPELIQAATMLRETATKKQNRGKGLHDAKKFVENSPGSFLSIHSNRGNYIYHHMKSGKKVGNLRRLNSSIGGTIIEWQLPIGDAA